MRDALLHRDEATALTWSDIAREDDGSDRLTIRRSKTDPKASGTVQYLARHHARPRRHPAPGCHARQQRVRHHRLAIQPAHRHSPRVGMAKDLAAAGVALPELM